MRFAVTLHLRDFVQRLPLGTQCGIFLVHPAAGIPLVHREQPAVGEIAVVGDSQRLPAGIFLIVLEPLVQVQRVGGSTRRLGGQRQDLPGPITVIAQDDIAVQVIALWNRGPLVAD